MDDTKAPLPEEISIAPFAENKVTKALKSPLFMTVALLFTISFGFNTLINLINYFFTGSLSLDIISLLVLIGLWMTYSAAKNTPVTDSVHFSGMNLVSGTVKATRMICLILSILCMVASVAFLIMIPIVNVHPQIAEGYMGEVQAILYMFLGQSFSMFDSTSMVTAFSVFMAIFFLVIGVLLLVVGYFLFLKKAHRFVYSLCENLKNDSEVENGKALSVWLMVLGILGAIATVFAGTFNVAQGVLAAALIVASCWIKTYFSSKKESAPTASPPQNNLDISSFQ